VTKSRGIRVRRGTRAKWLADEQGKHFCACGCGQPIRLQLGHFNTGIPRYVHGHNPNPHRVNRQRTPCACGCGKLASRGRRFVSGHNNVGQRRSPGTRRKLAAQKLGGLNPMFGKRSPRFIGRTRHQDGYWAVTAEHPFADAHGRVMEHRLVLEQHLRLVEPEHPLLVDVDGELFLRPGCHVHHVDGDPGNNAVENLRALTPAEHRREHAQLRTAAA
jgi:hypothetical protein